MSIPPPRPHRLFFALWPPDATRQVLHAATSRLVARSGGRAIPPENFHITLIFLGNVVSEEVDALKQAAGAAGAAMVSGFELQLGRVESWPGSRVLCAVAANSPTGLNALRASLNQCLPSEGRAHEHHSFQPHVTLARHLPRASRPVAIEPIPIEPIDWHVEDFVLVESHVTPSGSRYEVLARWPLVEPT